MKKDLTPAIQMYRNGEKILEIALKIHTKPENISRFLKENGIPVSARNQFRTKYSLNHRYFQKIDSPNKAYLLGWMYSDGFVNPISNTVGMILDDESPLLFFKSQIQLTKPLFQNPHHKKTTQTLTFASYEMKNDLIKLGCIPRKSLILEFPNSEQVPENLLPHFVRGYFDGDGSIYFNSGKSLMAKFISSTKFCIGLSKYLTSKGIKCSKLNTDKHHKKETSYFRIGAKKDLLKLKDLMYSDFEFCLERKRERFNLIN